ncbi:MAG: hypothetical protein V4573_05170 [Pseudomonadota bacterium]
MARIVMFGTVHQEQGVATISALHEILERAAPEVIFLEIPSAAFADYNAGVRSNLESSAARRYRESNDVALVPVDLPTPEESFFRDFQYLDRRITATSPEYRRLVDQNSSDISTGGFPYLNSQRSWEAWSNIYEEMEAAIQRLHHDSRLIEILELWKHTNECRERAMLERIDEYCLRNSFGNGVLLVGSAHSQSIINKSLERFGSGVPRIEHGDCC